MAWTSPRTWAAGEVLTATNLNTHVRDNFKVIGDAWTSYTPTWTSSGATQPTIGNGTLTGAYTKVGKLVFFRLKWAGGTTTTYGNGTYYWGLPVASVAADSVVAAATLTTLTMTLVVARSYSTTELQLHRVVDGTSSAAIGSGSSNFSSATVIINGSYEAA